MKKLAVGLLVIVLLGTVLVVPASATPPQTADGWFVLGQTHEECAAYDQDFGLAGDIEGYLCVNESMARAWDGLFGMTIGDKFGTCEGVVVIALTKPPVGDAHTNGYAQIHSNTCTGDLAGLHLHASFEWTFDTGPEGLYTARYHFDP
jgi:hypothetical protein